MELFHWVCPNKVTTMTHFCCKQAVERLNKRSYSISFQQQYSVKEAESLETETAESAVSEGSEAAILCFSNQVLSTSTYLSAWINKSIRSFTTTGRKYQENQQRKHQCSYSGGQGKWRNEP